MSIRNSSISFTQFLCQAQEKKLFAFLTSGQLAMFCFFATHRSSMKLQVFMQSTDVWLIIQGNEKRAAATKLVIFLLFSYFQKSNELLTQQTPFFRFKALYYLSDLKIWLINRMMKKTRRCGLQIQFIQIADFQHMINN